VTTDANPPRDDRRGKIAAAAVLALIGFAANSILCRKALGAQAIDAWSFTCIRLVGGASTLFLLVQWRRSRERKSSIARTLTTESPDLSITAARETQSLESSITQAPTTGGPDSLITTARTKGSWGSALALFGYAAAFSLAYLRLSAGVGALVLFACVQATMIGWGIKNGERPSLVEWMGIALALAGLFLLTLPGAVAPDPIGLVLMMSAGISWGAYSLRGRSSRAPLLSTADNFARSVPMAIAGVLIGLSEAHTSTPGIWLALASGCVASGIGYSLWYTALPGLSATRAAIVQLLVPILAATLGILFLGEPLTARLSFSALMILGGVALAIRGRRKPSAAPAPTRDASAVEAPKLSVETRPR
jgi:drug/metabolite transporter (DMT)-like permease